MAVGLARWGKDANSEWDRADITSHGEHCRGTPGTCFPLLMFPLGGLSSTPGPGLVTAVCTHVS